MDASSNLNLPFIASNQAQKHVTHNEAIRALDALVQLSVEARTLTEPPADPEEGQRWLIAAGAIGDWAGREGEIAAFQDGAWAFYAPRTGWLVWLADEQSAVVWDGAAWRELAPPAQGLNPAALVGVNATADAVNKFAVKSDAALLSHDDVTPGSGDMRLTLNKAGAGQTGSLVFQSNWSGRAEMGLAGDDDWRIKVSADGAQWADALVIDRATGAVAMPATPPITAPFNLLKDAGRFAGSPEPQSATVLAFEAQPWLNPIGDALIEAGPKYIFNNTDYGGTAGTLDSLVKELVDKLKAPAHRRYGVEYFLAKITHQTNTTGAWTSALDGVTRYFLFANDQVPIPAQYTGNIHIRVTSGSFLARQPFAGVQHFFDGVPIGPPGNGERIISPADGWVQWTVRADRPPREFPGYESEMWRCRVETGTVIYIAMPFVLPGHVPVATGLFYGVIPSLEAWR